MRLIAAIEDPAVAHKILESLKLPARAPPLERAAEPHPAVPGPTLVRIPVRTVRRPSGR